MKNKEECVGSRPSWYKEMFSEMLDVYLSKLPHNSSHFYMHPLKDIASDRTKPWYIYTAACQCDTLKAVLPNLFEESGCVACCV